MSLTPLPSPDRNGSTSPPGLRLLGSEEPPVQITGLRKRFGKLDVLKGVDAALESGRVTGIVGPNAAGKSTLIKAILGLTRPDGGQVRVHGQVVNGACEYRSAIGYMPQIAHFPENLCGREVRTLLERLRGQTEGLDDELFEAFALDSEMDKPVRTLSGGTRQKLNAAFAFLFRPSILVLDEPTAGLDPVASGIMKDKILAAKNQGTAVVLTSHVMAELEQLADVVLFLLDGRVRFDGTLAELHHLTGHSSLERAIATLMTQGQR